MAPEPRVVQEEAQASPEEPEPVVYQKNLLEKEKQKQAAAPPGQKNMDSMSGSGVGVEEEEKGKSDSSNTTCRDIRTRREVRS
jgi:hypothetical protein